jgi:hypothetical protein
VREPLSLLNFHGAECLAKQRPTVFASGPLSVSVESAAVEAGSSTSDCVVTTCTRWTVRPCLLVRRGTGREAPGHLSRAGFLNRQRRGGSPVAAEPTTSQFAQISLRGRHGCRGCETGEGRSPDSFRDPPRLRCDGSRSPPGLLSLDGQRFPGCSARMRVQKDSRMRGSPSMRLWSYYQLGADGHG